MHTNAKIAALFLALAVWAHMDVARAQTDAAPAPAPEPIPGVILVPPSRPAPLPVIRQPVDETCPAQDLKKLELIG